MLIQINTSLIAKKLNKTLKPDPYRYDFDGWTNALVDELEYTYGLEGQIISEFLTLSEEDL